ncbi:MAG: DUF3131 domain-containing protein [Gemmatimonadaceae bacterium]
MTIRNFTAIALTACAVACGSDATGPTQKSEDELFSDAARTAWAFIENNTQPSTGLAKAHEDYQFVTVWDIASNIAAVYSAHELGIIDDADYDGRITKILATLKTMPLFDGAGFNKFYDSETGQMVGRDDSPSATGYGWSDTDIGRLLVWLRILAVNQPQYSSQAAAIVNRLNYSRLISGGTLRAMELDANTGARVGYAETGLGYEQYAASGFALWSHRASSSLDATANAQPVDILGVKVWVDRRGTSRLLSEPYIMMGLETGWYADALRDQAEALLDVQQARHDQTGIVTMVSEDAMPEPPYYFYYYSVYDQGKTFAVEGPDNGSFVDEPRWVSSKAAFAWRALFPTDYTLTALTTVQPAAIPGHGWGAGVYEGSLTPTGIASLNTAGVILESVLYRERGAPFLSQSI